MLFSGSLERKKHEKILNTHLVEFPDYIKEYVQAQKQKNRSPSTLLGYLNDFKKFFSYLQQEGIAKVEKLADIPYSVLEHLSKDQLEHYIDYLAEEDIKKRDNVYRKRSDAAINRNIFALSSLFNYLTTETEDENGECYFYRNIMGRVQFTRNSETPIRRSSVLSPKIIDAESLSGLVHFVKHEYEKSIEGRKLASFNKNKERDVAILSLILGSGLKVSEVSNLTLDSIRFKESCIDVNGQHKVDITSAPLKDLKVYLEIRNSRYSATQQDVYVFITKYQGSAKPISVRTIQKLVHCYTKAFSQRELTPQQLRHSYAGEHLKNNNFNLESLSDQLGYKTISSTMQYINLYKREHKNILGNIRRSSER